MSDALRSTAFQQIETWTTGWSEAAGVAVLILNDPAGGTHQFAFPPETAAQIGKALSDIAEGARGGKKPTFILPN